MDSTDYGIKHAKEAFDALQGAPITTSLLAALLRNAHQDGRLHESMKFLNQLKAKEQVSAVIEQARAVIERARAA